MRDAINIGWKLDLVLRACRRGPAGDLRDGAPPHAQTIIETSIRLGDVAYTMDPVRAAARDEAFLSGSMPPPPSFPVLESGVIQTTGDGTPAPFAGTLAPQGTVSAPDGRSGRFDDVLGHGFTLVTRTRTDRLLDRVQEAFLDAIGCTVHTPAEGDARSFQDDAGTYTRYLGEIGADALAARGLATILAEGPGRGLIYRDAEDVKNGYLGIFTTVHWNRSITLRRFATENFVFDDQIADLTVVGEEMPNLPFKPGQRISMRLIHCFEMKDGKIAYEISRAWGGPLDNDEIPAGAVVTDYPDGPDFGKWKQPPRPRPASGQ